MTTAIAEKGPDFAAARVRRGLSVQQFATEIGISPDLLRRIEKRALVPRNVADEIWRAFARFEQRAVSGRNASASRDQSRRAAREETTANGPRPDSSPAER